MPSAMSTRTADRCQKATVTRLRTGCWTCRRRGYRCDEEKPACKTCRRLDVACEGYGVRLKWQHRWADGKTTTTMTAMTTPPSIEPPLPLLPHHSRTDVFLLQHYFFTVSSLLSSTPDRSVNTYLTTVLPLMLHPQHACLLQTVLALSAVHLASRFPGTAFGEQGARRKGAGMRGLIRRLAVGADGEALAPGDEGVLATILMLGILGVFEADAGLWSRHLEGAGSFLAAAYCNLEGGVAPLGHDSLTARKLLEIYAYHEVLASIALRRAPQRPFWRLQTSTSTSWSAFRGRPEKTTVFLSAVDSLLSLVAALARVRCAPSTVRGGPPDNAAGLVEQLRQWRCPDAAAYSVETRNTAEAMRQAGILFYHQLEEDAEDAPTIHPEATASVDTIVACLQPIAAHHSSVASHVWPLYMAGVSAQTAVQRAFIGHRLDEMIAVRGMQSIVQVRDRLDRLWGGRTGGRDVVLF